MALGFLSPTAWTGSRVFDASVVETVRCDEEDCAWEGDADVTYPDGATVGTWRCVKCGGSNETERDLDDEPIGFDYFE